MLRLFSLLFPASRPPAALGPVSRRPCFSPALLDLVHPRRLPGGLVYLRGIASPCNQVLTYLEALLQALHTFA